MNCPQILENIQNHISLSTSEKKLFVSYLKVNDVSKKERILQQGDICKAIFFVESGSLRAYNFNDEGKDSTIMFAVQDWWITDMNAFVNQKESLLSIELIEDSRIVELRFSALEEIYQKIPKFERFFRILFQNAYVREQLRVLDNISYSTEDRYYRFVEKYPQVVQKVTQKQIASYLGVTPEFLSKVKNK